MTAPVPAVPYRVPFRDGMTPGEGRAVAFPQADAAKVLLADVSEFQPQIADATYLAWSKAIVIRAAYGAGHDDRAWYGGERRRLLHEGGVKFLGIYQYLVAGQSGALQAQAFRDLVGDIRPGEVLIADYEEGSRTVLTDWYNKMHQLYPKDAWPYMWTYTGLNFGTEHGVLPVEWIAAYQAAEPSSPHTLWQFTDAYQVPGVGTCDCSVYHGTIGELAALAYPQSQTAAYGPVRNVVTGGNALVTISWDPPAPVPGLPPVPAAYRVYLHDAADKGVPGYPYNIPGTQTSVQLSLPRGKGFIFGVVPQEKTDGTDTQPVKGGPFTV